MSRAERRTPEETASKSRLRLWLRLLKTTGKVEETLRRRLREEFNTTLPRFDVMSALDRGPDGLKMSEISERLRVSNGNITGIVDRLTEEGLVLRVAVPGDRRATRVQLTHKGKTVFAEQAAAHEAWVDGMLRALAEDEIAGMMRTLDRLAHAHDEGERP